MFLENIKLAFKNLINNKLRTFLSILGILIGVGSVIAITTLGESTSASIKANIASAGMETITIYPGRDSDREVRRLFTPELGQRIKDEIQGIDAVVPINQGNYLLKYSRNSIESRVMAVTPKYTDVFDYETDQGQFISDEDNAKRKSVVVLGAEIAEELFAQGDAVGKYIRIFRNQARSFKVIGTMKPRSDSIGVSFDTSAYVPYDTFSQRLNRIDTVGSYSIGTSEGVDVIKVSQDIEIFLERLTGNPDSYRIMSPTTIADMFTQVTGTLNLFLSGIAAISLLVGGIGIMNIMLVSVTERTKEIGIRKALGASPRVIMGQFLTEAILITLLGGILGILIGTGISYLITSLISQVFVPQPLAFFVALVFSTIIGIFFGLYPAIRASKLDPVQALAFE
jgi:putative ABC transport system permease protein